MAYESTIVSTNADVAALWEVLTGQAVLGAWPGFHSEEDVLASARWRWRAEGESSRCFPASGSWEVERRILRDDLERPEIAFTCTSGRVTVVITTEVWALSPRIHLLRVGVRHGSGGWLRYSPRRLRRASQEFGKSVARRAGGEILEREGIETVQRLGILAAPDEASTGGPHDRRRQNAHDEPGGQAP